MATGRSTIRSVETQYVREADNPTNPKRFFFGLDLMPTEGAANVGFINFSDTDATASLGDIRFEGASTVLDLVVFAADFELIYKVLHDQSVGLDVVWTSDDATNKLMEWAITKVSRSGLANP